MTELIVNGLPMDIDSGQTVFSLNYLIADIREPDKRDANFSKTISLPGTKTNNRVFGYIFDVGVDLTFNPNKKASAIVLVDGIEQFRGSLQILKINRTNNLINYECAIFGSLADIFLTLGEKKLNELNLSEFDHTYNRGAIIDSWTGTITKSGFPFDNFTGAPVVGPFPNGTPDGVGYVYPMIDYGTKISEVLWRVEDFRPAIFTKQLIDKIFSLAGFEYESNFLTSAFFKKLINPFAAEKFLLTTAQIAKRLFNATRITSNLGVTYSTNGQKLLNFIHNNEVTDPSNVHNTTTGNYTVNFDGTYNLQTTGQVRLTYNPAVNNVRTGAATGFIELLINEVAVDSFPANFPALSVVNNNDNSATITYSINRQNINLKAGDVVRVRYRFDATPPSGATFGVMFVDNVGGGPVGGSITANLLIGAAFFNSAVNNGMTNGETVSLNQVLPDNILIKDYLMSIIRMFNLYVWPDKENERKVIIEPRNDFYAGGVTKDWTAKLDIGQDHELIPMGELSGREYLFSYKPDSDYFNSLYTSQVEEVYGQRRIDVDNDFLNNQVKIEPIFSPTPIVEISPGRVIPSILQIDATGRRSSKGGNMRILIYNGLNFSSAVPYQIGLGTPTLLQYPFSGHYDNFINPTVDINFGLTRHVYYNGITNISNNNLFNKYYKTHIEEITNKNSKILIGWFYLNKLDILNLDFRDTILVDGHYYRLNKVIDYNPATNGLTKCELFTLIQRPAFVPETTTTNGGGDVTLGGEVVPVLDNTGGSVKNNGNIEDVRPDTGVSVVVGKENIVGANTSEILINGNGNIIHQDAKCINILCGDDNVIFAGVENVTLINSNGLEIRQSNSIYIDNVLFRDPVFGNNVVLTPVTVGNTTTENTIYSVDLIENQLKEGEVFAIRNLGFFSTFNASSTFTLRFYIDTTLVDTIVSPSGNVTDSPIDSEFIITVKSVGVSGSVSSFIQLFISNENKSKATSADTTVDTTQALTFSITAEWSTANEGNTLTINQGFRRLINQQ